MLHVEAQGKVFSFEAQGKAFSVVDPCGVDHRFRTWVHPYFIESVYWLVLESQTPYKVVDLLFTTTNLNIELTVLWES